MTVRTVFFWLHLTAGVIAGAIILLMSVTGVALTYERQLIKWSDREFKSTPNSSATRMTVEQLVAEFRRQQPDAQPTAVTVAAEPLEPVAVNTGQRTVYVDAYSGQVLGTGEPGHAAVHVEAARLAPLAGHRGRGRPTARAVTGWANVLFLFIVLSGHLHLVPAPVDLAAREGRSRSSSPALRGKARDFNWHNVIGIWSAVPLFIVVASAVPISFPWGNDLVYRAVGEEPPARGGGRGGGEGAEGAGRAGGAGRGRGREARHRARAAAVGRRPDGAAGAGAAQQEPDWRTINVRVPASPDAPVVFAIDRGDGGQPQLRSTLTLTRAGQVVVATNRSAPSPPAGRCAT